MCDLQTVVTFPSSLYFRDTESPCVQCIFHRWLLRPQVVSRLVARQRPGSGMENCFPSLHWPTLEDAGWRAPGGGAALLGTVPTL